MEIHLTVEIEPYNMTQEIDAYFVSKFMRNEVERKPLDVSRFGKFYVQFSLKVMLWQRTLAHNYTIPRFVALSSLSLCCFNVAY